jgi:hypothetical protein
LRSTAVDLGPPGTDNTFGSGRIDAFAAVQSVVQQAPPIPKPTPSASQAGDANGDGVINILDVTATLNDILDIAQAPGNADCNNDGNVNILDVTCVLNVILGTSPTDGVPDRMDDEFFEQNAVTYTGEFEVDGGETVEIVKVLTSDLTPPAPLCTIVINTVVMGIPATLTLVGVIEEDGVTCTFDGSDTTIETSLGNFDAMIISGFATLSDDGQVLSLSEIVADVEQPIGVQTVPAVGPCNCVSVEPIVQEARTQDAQRMHREKMIELGIEIGN